MSNIRPKALVFSGYGLNCEEETKYAFEFAGAKADIIHINDLIEKKEKLFDYQVAVFPGGFSFGDDTGSGNGFANKVRNHLWEQVKKFVEKDHLLIGICNGFQILTRLSLLSVDISLLPNNSARYMVRWVDLKATNKSPWLVDIDTVSMPIAHGEGRFYADGRSLNVMKKKNMIALTFVKGEICQYQSLEANPNGSLENIAGVTDESGRIFGLMPHPERAIFFTQLPNWPYLKEAYTRKGKKLPEYGPGLQIFKNAVHYFQ